METKGKKSKKATQDLDTVMEIEPGYLLLRLYRAYEPLVEKHLWPWETLRWQELVFCILVTVTRREVTLENIREITQLLGEINIIDIERLGSLNLERDSDDSLIVTITTILQESGFTADESLIAVSAICEAAGGFMEHFGSKIQKYLRNYGELMLAEIEKCFSFSQLSKSDSTRVFSLWLQNVLNMPIASPDSVTEQACQLLGVEYESLIEVADEVDVNIALLDNVLRAYWESDIELGEEDESH